MKYTLLVIILCIGAVGCDDDDSNVLEKRNAFLLEALQIKCERIMECCEVGGSFLGQYSTVEECMLQEAIFMDVLLPPEETGFNQSAADAYFEWYGTNTDVCGTDVSSFHESINMAMLREAVPHPGDEGAHCTFTWGCAPKLVCRNDACYPLGDVNDPCENISGCLAGLMCMNDLCVEPMEAGDACDNSYCYGDLIYCDLGTDTCAPKKRENEACQENAECQSLSCVDNLCIEDRTFEYVYCADPE